MKGNEKRKEARMLLQVRMTKDLRKKLHQEARKIGMCDSTYARVLIAIGLRQGIKMSYASEENL